MLQTSLEHGILKPHDTTAYSYCTAGGGEAMDHTNYDSCIPCISAEGRTDYLANCKPLNPDLILSHTNPGHRFDGFRSWLPAAACPRCGPGLE